MRPQTCSLRPQFIARAAVASSPPPPPSSLHPDLLLHPPPCPRQSSSSFPAPISFSHPRRTALPDLSGVAPSPNPPPWGPKYTLYPLQGGSTCRGLGWVNQAFLTTPPSLHSMLLLVKVPLRGVGEPWPGSSVGWAIVAICQGCGFDP